MKKPKEQNKKHFDYFEVKEYIVKIYNCEKDAEMCWDYMCESLEIRNDSYSYIPTYSDELKGNKFIEAVKEEFGENLEVWISW